MAWWLQRCFWLLPWWTSPVPPLHIPPSPRCHSNTSWRLFLTMPFVPLTKDLLCLHFVSFIQPDIFTQLRRSLLTPPRAFHQENSPDSFDSRKSARCPHRRLSIILILPTIRFSSSFPSICPHLLLDSRPGSPLPSDALSLLYPHHYVHGSLQISPRDLYMWVLF